MQWLIRLLGCAPKTPEPPPKYKTRPMYEEPVCLECGEEGGAFKGITTIKHHRLCLTGRQFRESRKRAPSLKRRKPTPFRPEGIRCPEKT